MASSLERICATVHNKVMPSPKKRKRVLTLAEELRQKVMKAAEEARVDAEVRIEGSVAKNTWLSTEPDIDIFMCLPPDLPRRAFGEICLAIARKATQGFTQIERFAEHPYLEVKVDDVLVNIVPCYKVKKGEWISATDRTPFHTDYMKPLLDETKCEQVRLLKKFMNGIGVYGAEIKVGGFSGYLCELLTLHYGSFIEVLKSAADWKQRTIIDFEGYYAGREEEAEKAFEEPLVVVDPVDKGRNAAAAVRKERFDELIAATRTFLINPNLDFFYPRSIEALKPERLVSALKSRGSTLVFVKFGKIQTVSDILWGQLYKSQRALRKMLRQNDFNIICDSVWSDEESFNVLIFEVEQPCLPLMKKHRGPPLRKRIECERFLQKHLGALHTIAGPRVEDGRWVVEIKRKHTDIVNLFSEKLRGGGRRVGVGELVSQAIAKDFVVLMGEKVLKLYSTNSEFAKFLTAYLDGKPRWLR